MRRKCCLCRNKVSRGGLSDPSWRIICAGENVKYLVHRVCFLAMKNKYAKAKT